MKKQTREKYNIKYVITGKEDGRWVVRAFDRKGKRLGIDIIVCSADEAYKIFWVLNGYGFMEPDEIRRHMDDTQEIDISDLEKAS